MDELVARVDQVLVTRIDELVSRGVAPSRSDVLRISLEEFLARQESQPLSHGAVELNRRHAHSRDELADRGRPRHVLYQEEPW